jgi:hypothetical protein
MKDKPFYQTIKTSLKSVVKDEVVIEKLTYAATCTKKIMTHCLQFLKLYLIYLFDTGNALPAIDKPFVNAVMNILCKKTDNRGKPPKAETQDLKQKLTKFHQEHYEPLMEGEILNYLHLNTVLDYMAEGVISEDYISAHRYSTMMSKFQQTE